jgi:hypothetical protein
MTTSMTNSLLVELFVEELPPKALKKLGDAFAGVLRDQLVAQGLAEAGSVLTAYASPRRLAAHLTHVAERAADKAVSQKLMPVAVGLDASGQPTPALLKRLGALGADASAVPGLKRAMDGKAEALFYESTAKGATLAEGLQKALAEAIAKLPIPKVMTYQLEEGSELPGWTSVSFVRPAHGLVALHGSTVVPIEALGLKAGRDTHGHRFEAAVDPVVLRDANSYALQLQEDGAVIASFEARRAEIARQLAAAAVQGRRRLGADRRRRAARRSDRAGRAAQRAGLRLRARVSRSAAGVPHPHDEGQPEVLSAARRTSQAHQQVPGGEQHQPRRRERGHRRQRARGAPAPGRRQVLLRPGPQEVAGLARRVAGQGGLSQQAGHAGRARAARDAHRARDRGRLARSWAMRSSLLRPRRPPSWPRPTW